MTQRPSIVTVIAILALLHAVTVLVLAFGGDGPRFSGLPAILAPIQIPIAIGLLAGRDPARVLFLWLLLGHAAGSVAAFARIALGEWSAGAAIQAFVTLVACVLFAWHLSGPAAMAFFHRDAHGGHQHAHS